MTQLELFILALVEQASYSRILASWWPRSSDEELELGRARCRVSKNLRPAVEAAGWNWRP